MYEYKKKFLKQKGQAAVIVTILIVCLLGAVALVIDIGSLYQKRGFFQNVADASALAGVQELPEDRDAAVLAAVDYAARNNVDIIYNCRDYTSEEIEISSTLSINDTITVALSNREAPLYFAKIFGQDTVSLGASATAMVGSPSQLFGVVPWAAIVPERENWASWLRQVVGDDMIISGDMDESDFYAWDDTDHPGGWIQRYMDRIIDGYSKPLEVGDIIYAREINIEQTIKATDIRVGIWDPFYDIVEYDYSGIYRLIKDDTQFVIVPLVREIRMLGWPGPGWPGPGWPEKTEILAFAPFVLVEKDYGHGPGHGNRRIIGRFINQAIIINESDIEGIDQSGIKVVRLVR
jgi:Flp pilus assembly protein TadG